MTYDEHCKHIELLGDQGIAAMDAGDADAAMLYAAALVDYLLRYGDEMRRDAPPADQVKLEEMRRAFRTVREAIEERLGPRKTWQ